METTKVKPDYDRGRRTWPIRKILVVASLVLATVTGAAALSGAAGAAPVLNTLVSNFNVIIDGVRV